MSAAPERRVPAKNPALAGDDGNAIVEFALWLPLVLIALCSVLQLTAQLYAQRAAHSAAVAGALAQQSGHDPTEAVQAALQSEAGGDDATVTVDDGQVKVTMPVHQFLPWLPQHLKLATGTAQGEPEQRP